MQNPLSVPPKDQGDVSMSTSPVEKHLSPQMSESPGKTVCTVESSNTSGTTQSGKGLQNKSQFRTIAPKIVPKVLTSRVLPCHSPSLSDQGNLGPSIKPLGMPTQNYALMQVAGQEGTFSLVALPHVASPQPVQKPRMPENLKLPIPRYQPPRSNKGSRRKTILSSPESGYNKSPAQTQMCPQMSPVPAHPEIPHKPSSCKKLPSLDMAPASINTAILTSGSDHRDSRSPVTNNHGDVTPPAMPALSTPGEPCAKQSFPKISERINFTSKKIPSKPSAVASEKLKEQVDHTKAITSLSPTILGGAVQLTSSVPRGKLPILPYSRMKTAEVCKIESDANIADFSLPGADCDKRFSITEDFNAATKMASKMPVPQVSKQSLCESAFCPVTKLDLNHKTKLNSGAAKRRGRKRKIPDEILTFQGKRRKCILNKCRDGKERAKNDPQETREQKPGILKKYRSIMPKPVIVVSALAPLASPAAVLPSQTPCSLGQDTLLNNSLTSKYLSCKQNDSPSSKPSSVFRNGFSGIKKPWYRCHVCNHHFQFKQHLRDHMNTHTNKRPYSCRICRKAYVRSGSLSTHMRLHHSENRLKKLVCCEFCAKVFGHTRVYFGHLKEVHRVVISTEPSPEPQPGAMPKNRDRDPSVQGMEGPLERENKSNLEEDFLLNQADEVKLQIKCGRCQITAQSFAEIKFHLLYVHGEEIQGRLQEGILPGTKGAQEALVKHVAPDWKQHPERRRQVKPCASEEEYRALPKLKRPLYLHHQNGVEILMENEGGQQGANEPGEEPQDPECPSPHTVLLWSHSGFNCLLCTQTLGRKEELFLHWEHRHNCEDPSKLWAILSTFSNQGVIELSSKTGK
ncbi:zinc finger protein 438 isoform X1 [Sciurus carolinensis]|nr:zinc finger protein 438 isoform X1 [Sciurus carolinensis]XP_047376972.1 zinc finger protein 438 isoform X1 [Sciurus carolinensis]XP_047376973.1 zinc finger protein 438 isoform X1 [Sciurus carolinensis]XP_047376974.1 zinc finger protein 438 isoform X1 [Sciurus carolinensis]XP_047376976.1 zinc finger protein 438 isoform X1 [Sciurus carolinensis]XP_047376977.1 zinc finger protein 438 isoform X1 [Sciurus carolinensis]XP_047376978.1 zinc finger protein 438 isoform X1 [Sciurus carolinensis]XP_0